MIEGIKLDHGLFTYGYDNLSCRTRRGDRYIPIPLKFRELLMKRLIKSDKHIEFSFGISPSDHIGALAIVRPPDQFSRKIGKSIIVGRIKKMREGGYSKPYPEWIYKLDEEDDD